MSLGVASSPTPPFWRGLLETVLEAVPTGVAVVRGAQFAFELSNRVFHELLSGPASAGRPLAEAWPQLAPRLLPMLRRALEGGERQRATDVPLRVGAAGAGGRDGWFTIEIHRISEDQLVVSATETTEWVRARTDAEGAARAARDAASRLARLQKVTSALTRAMSPVDVARLVLATAVESLGATAGNLAWLAGTDEVELLASMGLEEDLVSPWPPLRLDPDVPIGEAVRERRGVWVESPEELERRFPSIAGRHGAPEHRAWAIVPLLSGHRALGALTLSFTGPRSFPPDDRAILQSLGHAAAQSLERARTEERLRAVVAADAGGLALFTGSELRVSFANEAFLACTGDPSRTASGLAPEEIWRGPDGIRVRALLERAAHEPVVASERLERTDEGRRRSFVLHASSLPGRGEREVLLASWETTELETTRTRAERARERAELLAEMAAELSAGHDLDAVFRTALERGMALLGADDGALFLLEDDDGHLRGLLEAWPRERTGMVVDLARWPHSLVAVRSLRPVAFTRSSAGGDEGLAMDRAGIGATIVAPLAVGGRCLGLLHLNERLPVRVGEEELEFAAVVANQCAMAIARARAFEAERSARARAETAEIVTRRIAQRLAASQDLTAALSSSHTPDAVAGAILEKGLGAVGARAGTIFVPHGEGALRLLSDRGHDPAALERWREPFPVSFSSPACDAFRDGVAVFVRDEEVLAARWPHLVEPARALGDAGRVALPLVVDGRAVGVLDLGFAEARELDIEERAFMGSIALKCAQALDRARLYEAERNARAEAERVGKLQEQLLAIVGHDLKTPLSAITMGASVLFRRGGLDERQAQTLSRIATSAQRMSGIIRDLLDFSRARQGGGIPITAGPVDVGEAAAKAVLELQAAHPQRDIRLAVRGKPLARGDMDRLVQVVSNLVGNAVQHGPPAGRIDVGVDAEGEAIRLTVHNGGPPIAPELLPSLFEPFKRGDDGAAAEGASVGLGLFIVREIVRAHGGNVHVRSEAGEGTTFTVVLPGPER